MKWQLQVVRFNGCILSESVGNVLGTGLLNPS
jgi:hypothetical protein